jgi:spore maturation protein CgeB
MGRTFQGEIASRFLWNENMTPLVQHAARQLLIDRQKPLPAIISETCRTLSFVLPFKDARNLTWLASYIIHCASMLLRKEMAEACLPLGLATFGDPDGWRALLGNGVAAHADIDYRTGLSAVYRSIAINLNVTSCQMPTAVNQRVFDVPLCGGFVLSDSQSDIGELFASDEIAVYFSRSDLIDKISYFRARPDEREHLAANARAAVLARHTYDHRIVEIEKILL